MMTSDSCSCFIKHMNLKVGDVITTSYSGNCNACGNHLEFQKIYLRYLGDVLDEKGIGFYHFFEPAFPFSCVRCENSFDGVQFFCYPGKYEFIESEPGANMSVRTLPIKDEQ